MPEANKLKIVFQEKIFTEVKADELALLLTKDDLSSESKTRKKGQSAPSVYPQGGRHGRILSLFPQHKAQIEAALKASEFTGDKGQQVTIYSIGKHRVVFLIGLGEKSQLTNEKVRRAAAAGIKSAQSTKASTMALAGTRSRGGTALRLRDRAFDSRGRDVGRIQVR